MNNFIKYNHLRSYRPFKIIQSENNFTEKSLIYKACKVVNIFKNIYHALNEKLPKLKKKIKTRNSRIYLKLGSFVALNTLIN